jgi:hypothetical protein
MANRMNSQLATWSVTRKESLQSGSERAFFLRGHFIFTELREGLPTPTQNFIAMGNLEREQRAAKV